MSESLLVRDQNLADANLIESIREHARWQAGGELVEDDQLLLFAGSSVYPGAYRNCAVRLDPRLPAPHALQRARDFFAERRRGFTFWVRTGRDDDLDAHLPANGLTCVVDGACMLVTRPLAIPAVAADLRIERFTNERSVRDAITVNADAYTVLGLSADEAHATFPEPLRLISDRVIGFVVYREDRPVATALTIVQEQAAGLYWVGTVTSAQRSGLGGVCTTLATHAAFERGARVVMLHASKFGEPLYARLGYRTYGRARWYRQVADHTAST